MIRYLNQQPISIGVTYVELAGTSLDTKPTDHIATGSLFFEVDTTDVYTYDETNHEWNKV